MPAYMYVHLTCSDAVTGICYVPQTGVLWIAAGSTQPLLYEPKSGDNVTIYFMGRGYT